MARLRLRAEGRPQAPRAVAGARTTTTSWPASRPSPPTGALALGFAISPGLSIDPDDPTTTSRALAAKVDQVVGARARLGGAGPRRHPLRRRPAGRGPRRADHLAARPPRRPRRAARSCPPSTSASRPSPYLDELAAGVPEDVPIAWTGRAVVNDAITVADAEARAASLGGRPPLRLGQLPRQRRHHGRPPLPRAAARPGGRAARRLLRLPGQPDGPAARLPPAPRLDRRLGPRRGPRGGVGRQRRATSGGWPSPRPATASPPHEVVAGGDLRAIRAHFADAAACARPGLEEEAEPWLAQAHLDARPGAQRGGRARGRARRRGGARLLLRLAGLPAQPR